MFINQIGVQEPQNFSTNLSNKKELSFKANYQQIYKEGVQLIEKNATQNSLKNALAIIKSKFRGNSALPQVETALVAFFSGFQSKKDFFKEYAEKLENGEYIPDSIRRTAETLNDLFSRRVIKSYDIPDYQVMFNNGVIEQSAYAKIKQCIIDSPALYSDYQRQDFLNKLGRDNYHPEDVCYNGLSFKGLSPELQNSDLTLEDLKELKETLGTTELDAGDLDSDDAGDGLLSKLSEWFQELIN